MSFKAVLVEKTARNGNPYVAIEVYITEKVKKLVFLNESELELIKINAQSK